MTYNINSLSDIKQLLLDEVFVISGIIKVSVSVISRAGDLDYFRISQKTDLKIVLLHIVLNKIMTNTPSQRT